MKKQYDFINIMRVVCALFVVYIHTCNDSLIQQTIKQCIAYQAVPFFFIISGFFFAKRFYEKGIDKSYVKKYIINIFTVYLFWAVLWLPVTIKTYFSLGHSFLGSLALVLWNIFIHGSNVYWYIYVLAFSVLFLYLALKYNKELLLYIICIIFYLVTNYYIYQSYILSLNHNDFNIINKFLYYFGSRDSVIDKGLIFVTIGSVFAKYYKTFLMSKKCINIILYLIMNIISIFIFMHYNVQNIVYFLLIFQVPLLFLLSLNINKISLNQQMNKYLRNVSSVIYLTHVFFGYIFRKTLNIHFGFNNIYASIITIGICVILPIILWWITENTQIKFLKYILLMK